MISMSSEDQKRIDRIAYIAARSENARLLVEAFASPRLVSRPTKMPRSGINPAQCPRKHMYQTTKVWLEAKRREHETLPKQVTKISSLYQLRLLDQLTGNKTI